ncbi:uncharacterized protein NEMAJ01_1878, partial [Nematocida major]|uniref:uncharacterized protein n=1 Tax=Nematocida major TaxID=1912982 RepID=UPI0020081D98
MGKEAYIYAQEQEDMKMRKKEMARIAGLFLLQGRILRVQATNIGNVGVFENTFNICNHITNMSPPTKELDINVLPNVKEATANLPKKERHQEKRDIESRYDFLFKDDPKERSMKGSWKTTKKPTEEKTTKKPAEEKTTKSPIEKTTKSPTEEKTTKKPVEEKTTMSPAEEKTTKSPTEEKTTKKPTEEKTEGEKAKDQTDTKFSPIKASLLSAGLLDAYAEYIEKELAFYMKVPDFLNKVFYKLPDSTKIAINAMSNTGYTHVPGRLEEDMFRQNTTTLIGARTQKHRKLQDAIEYIWQAASEKVKSVASNKSKYIVDDAGFKPVEFVDFSSSRSVIQEETEKKLKALDKVSVAFKSELAKSSNLRARAEKALASPDLPMEFDLSAEEFTFLSNLRILRFGVAHSLIHQLISPSYFARNNFPWEVLNPGDVDSEKKFDYPAWRNAIETSAFLNVQALNTISQQDEVWALLDNLSYLMLEGLTKFGRNVVGAMIKQSKLRTMMEFHTAVKIISGHNPEWLKEETLKESVQGTTNALSSLVSFFMYVNKPARELEDEFFSLLKEIPMYESEDGNSSLYRFRCNERVAVEAILRMLKYAEVFKNYVDNVRNKHRKEEKTKRTYEKKPFDCMKNLTNEYLETAIDGIEDECALINAPKRKYTSAEYRIAYREVEKKSKDLADIRIKRFDENLLVDRPRRGYFGPNPEMTYMNVPGFVDRPCYSSECNGWIYPVAGTMFCSSPRYYTIEQWRELEKWQHRERERQKQEQERERQKQERERQQREQWEREQWERQKREQERERQKQEQEQREREREQQAAKSGVTNTMDKSAKSSNNTSEYNYQKVLGDGNSKKSEGASQTKTTEGNSKTNSNSKNSEGSSNNGLVNGNNDSKKSEGNTVITNTMHKSEKSSNSTSEYNYKKSEGTSKTSEGNTVITNTIHKSEKSSNTISEHSYHKSEGSMSIINIMHKSEKSSNTISEYSYQNFLGDGNSKKSEGASQTKNSVENGKKSEASSKTKNSEGNSNSKKSEGNTAITNKMDKSAKSSNSTSEYSYQKVLGDGNSKKSEGNSKTKNSEGNGKKSEGNAAITNTMDKSEKSSNSTSEYSYQKAKKKGGVVYSA